MFSIDRRTGREHSHGGQIHDFIVKHIVADVPDAVSACLDCGFVQCLNEKWDTCPNRLARVAGLRAIHVGDTAKPAEAAACETPSSTNSAPATQRA